MINNVNSSNIAGVNAKDIQQRPSGKPARGEESDVTVQVQYDSLVSQAVDSDVDAQAVEKAKEIIDSGQLDTPENIREAATNIVQYGV